MRYAGALAGGVIAAAAWVCAAAQEASPLLEAQGFRLEGRDNTLLIYDVAAKRELKRIPAAEVNGARLSQVSAIHFSEKRRSFVVSFDRLPEIWEVSIDPKAPDIHQGLVHDFRMGESVPERGFLGVRRTRLDAAVPAIALDASGAYATGCRADSPIGQCTLVLVHLDVRRKIAQFSLAGIPDRARANDVRRAGRPWLDLVDPAGTVRWRVDLTRDRLEEVAP